MNPNDPKKPGQQQPSRNTQPQQPQRQQQPGQPQRDQKPGQQNPSRTGDAGKDNKGGKKF